MKFLQNISPHLAPIIGDILWRAININGEKNDSILCSRIQDIGI